MDTVLRVTLVYLFLMTAMRVVGKREFGQLGPFDLVVLLLIPEMVTGALTHGDDSITTAVVGVATLLGLVFLTSLVAYRFKRIGDLIEGKPIVIVQAGQWIEAHMARERVSPGEVVEAIHHAGLERLEQVKWAVLGSDGKISIIPFQAVLPVPRHPRDVLK